MFSFCSSSHDLKQSSPKHVSPPLALTTAHVSRPSPDHPYFLPRSVGQTCGTSYGECRGLSTYTIMAIVLACIIVMGICVRFCALKHSGHSSQSLSSVVPHPRTVPAHTQYPANYAAMPPSHRTPVHNVTEEAPPSYAAAISMSEQPPKY